MRWNENSDAGVPPPALGYPGIPKSAFLARYQDGRQEMFQMLHESQEYKLETPGRQG